MATYHIRFQLSPPAYFGLPDGEKVVVPATPAGQEVVTPVIDTWTGRIASHGTLSKYRLPPEAMTMDLRQESLQFTCHDNFATLTVDASGAQSAYNTATTAIDLFTQALTVQFGDRFTSEYLGIEDEHGTPLRIARPFQVSLGTTAFYNLHELRDRLTTAFGWTLSADPKSRKALLYFEHACILKDVAATLPPMGPHAGFTQALAFLQLFKALVTIVGEPGKDRDYQSRFVSLGLPASFYEERVKPLYLIRNDEDVAHYSLAVPDYGTFLGRFLAAGTSCRDALAAYMTAIRPSRPDA